MVDAIREFFERYIKRDTAAARTTGADSLQLATAALLIEMMRMDGQPSVAERDRVVHAIQTKFALTPEQVNELLCLAEAEAREAVDYFQFTSLIKDQFDAVQRERLIEHLWAIAYADGTLHPYEEHLIRKIADLLYVPHAAFIAAKLRAKPRAG
jgi:uncharacterized tellurite resistance protein B-like protein